MREIRITIAGLPPAKNEAKSMLAAGHVHQPRVMALLLSAREALGDHAEPAFPTGPLGLELTIESPEEPLADPPTSWAGWPTFWKQRAGAERCRTSPTSRP